MLLSAVVLATALQGEPTSDLPSAMAAVHERIAARQATRARASHYVAAYKPKNTCQTEGLEFTDQPVAPRTMKKLGDLPLANHTLTVLRSVDGCPVSSTVRYNVDLPARR